MPYIMVYFKLHDYLVYAFNYFASNCTLISGRKKDNSKTKDKDNNGWGSETSISYKIATSRIKKSITSKLS